MFGKPMFDLKDAAGILMEVNSCRKTFPNHYIRVTAFDSTRGVESIAMSFIVNRPEERAGLRARAPGGRGPHDSLHHRSYATDKPEAPSGMEPEAPAAGCERPAR